MKSQLSTGEFWSPNKPRKIQTESILEELNSGLNVITQLQHCFLDFYTQLHSESVYEIAISLYQCAETTSRMLDGFILKDFGGGKKFFDLIELNNSKFITQQPTFSFYNQARRVEGRHPPTESYSKLSQAIADSIHTFQEELQYSRAQQNELRRAELLPQVMEPFHRGTCQLLQSYKVAISNFEKTAQSLNKDKIQHINKKLKVFQQRNIQVINIIQTEYLSRFKHQHKEIAFLQKKLERLTNPRSCCLDVLVSRIEDSLTRAVNGSRIFPQDSSMNQAIQMSANSPRNAVEIQMDKKRRSIDIQYLDQDMQSHKSYQLGLGEVNKKWLNVQMEEQKQNKENINPQKDGHRNPLYEKRDTQHFLRLNSERQNLQEKSALKVPRGNGIGPKKASIR